MPKAAGDRRPPVWVGHVVLTSADVPAADAFWTRVGMRPIARGDGFAVLELRGGTHLVLQGSGARVAAGTPCPFDIMVEDLEAAHARYRELGLAPGDLRRGSIHDSFTIVDPSGYVVTINSSHVSGEPV
jgi:hypothetical protein